MPVSPECWKQCCHQSENRYSCCSVGTFSLKSIPAQQAAWLFEESSAAHNRHCSMGLFSEQKKKSCRNCRCRNRSSVVDPPLKQKADLWFSDKVYVTCPQTKNEANSTVLISNWHLSVGEGCPAVFCRVKVKLIMAGVAAVTQIGDESTGAWCPPQPANPETLSLGARPLFFLCRD